MMYLLRESVAGRLVSGVVAGIKCRTYLDPPLTTRMVKSVTVRLLGNCMASDFPVGNLKMDITGSKKAIDVPLFFTEMNTQKNTVPVGNPKIDNSCRRKKQIDFPQFFAKIKAQMKTHHQIKAQMKTRNHNKRIPNKRIHGPVFTGEVEKTYLEYLDKLDWDSFHRHVIDYPRRRSENEKRCLFKKWASHHGKKYPSAELREMSFTSFKRCLAFIDESNSVHDSFTLGLSSNLLDRLHGNVSEFPKKDDTGRKTKIYFPSYFRKMKALQKTDHHKKRFYGPIFTGEVEKRYLEYLKKLDWDSFQKHVADIPRRRSYDEKRLIYDRWAAHSEDFGFEDSCDESKDFTFEAFEERLDYIDNVNSKTQEGLTLTGLLCGHRD